MLAPTAVPRARAEYRKATSSLKLVRDRLRHILLGQAVLQVQLFRVHPATIKLTVEPSYEIPSWVTLPVCQSACAALANASVTAMAKSFPSCFTFAPCVGIQSLRWSFLSPGEIS